MKTEIKPEHQAEAERLAKENNILRLLVAKVGKSCHYCGLTNMGECESGFPGCALADDLMVGEDEFVQMLRKERDQLRVELALANKRISEYQPYADNALTVASKVIEWEKCEQELTLARKCVEASRRFRRASGFWKSLSERDDAHAKLGNAIAAYDQFKQQEK